jgi:L-threonylcarbamoyladenylate synthase
MYYSFNIDDELKPSLIMAESIFRQNGIFIYPTDTIYGIGGNPFKKKVKDKIIHLKKRDDSKYFIFLIGSIEMLTEYIDANSSKVKMLENIWPAPVSVILKLKNKYAEQLQQDTAAFRIPKNEFCIKLLNNIRLPLISTSVNKMGEKPLNDYNEIIKQFSDQVDAVFYSGTKNSPVSSMIVDMTGNEPKLIREGSTNFMDLLKKLS